MAYQRNRKSYKSFSKIDSKEIHYTNIGLLKKCLTESGRIVPCRITGNTPSQQRKITAAIKTARLLALLPFSHAHK